MAQYTRCLSQNGLRQFRYTAHVSWDANSAHAKNSATSYPFASRFPRGTMTSTSTHLRTNTVCTLARCPWRTSETNLALYIYANIKRRQLHRWRRRGTPHVFVHDGTFQKTRVLESTTETTQKINILGNTLTNCKTKKHAGKHRANDQRARKHLANKSTC